MFLFFTHKGFCVKVKMPDAHDTIIEMRALIIFPVNIALGDSTLTIRNSAQGEVKLSVKSGKFGMIQPGADYGDLKSHIITLIDELHSQL